MNSPIDLKYPQPDIAWVTLNRPDARNAVDGAMARELERTVAATEANAEIRVVVLTGAAGAFCSGADLREVAHGRVLDLATAAGGFAGFVKARRTKIWLAAVNGPAVAGGFEIALACDLAIASRAALFALPEVKRGLVATAGGLYRLPRLIPKAVAMEMIATGEPIDAARAFALGLVSRLVDGDRLVETAMDLARAIGRNAPIAVRESVRLARRCYEMQDEDLRAASEAAGVEIARTHDFIEGARAFKERREPRWTGT